MFCLTITNLKKRKMYLLQLDESGLVSDDVIGDSWKAVSVFRELVNKYKREGLTVVALAVDYDSLLSFYNPTDRYIRAVEEVFGSRNKFKKNELISKILQNTRLFLNRYFDKNIGISANENSYRFHYF